MLKVWDLERQLCVGTFGDSSLTKVYDFCLIGELGILVAGGIDKELRIFMINVLEEESGVGLKMNSSVTKESNHRVI